jgi:hypothetical protein
MADPILKPDLSLLRFFPYSEFREQGYPPVSVTEFKRGPFCLYYINASHFFGKKDNDKKNKKKSRDKKLFPMDTVTHQTVMQAFDKLRFNAVVMEMCGQPRELYPTYIAEAEALARAKPPRCHEMQLSVVLARAKGLPLINAERPEKATAVQMLAKRHGELRDRYAIQQITGCCKPIKECWSFMGLTTYKRRNPFLMPCLCRARKEFLFPPIRGRKPRPRHGGV